jgi:hypothetical protein
LGRLGNFGYIWDVIEAKRIMSPMKKACVGILVLICLCTEHLSGQDHNEEKKLELFLDHLFSATEVMVSDVTSPTGAARFYSYILLAAHGIQEDLEGSGSLSPLHGQFVAPFTFQPESSQKEELNAAFCSIYGMLEVGKAIMPSGKKLEVAQEKLIDQFIKSKSIRKKSLNSQIAYAKGMAQQVVTYASSDGYNKLSTLKRYSPNIKEEGRWYPTPPSYMAAIDPEWQTIRPFFIENIEHYMPSPPAPFDLEEGSSFQKQLSEVFETVNQLDDEQLLIANFWDCNPFHVSYSGHMAIGHKKISPGGHWIGITGIASQKAGISLREAIRVHALVAMGLHDGFVSCWKEKYHSDRVRPITAINKYVDPAWQPPLQTPPFPEYTSGHSVISRVSARILTAYFGDNFDFIDDSEVYFGLPEREFQSFLQASEEAAISRLYGGIHFRDAIEEGVKQGDKIADDILERINVNQWQLAGQ